MNDKTKCVICWQVLSSKKLLLHGRKCQRFQIYEKLRLILPPLDFKTLYDKQVFPEPRICNLCFVTIKQIAPGIKQLQDLLGSPINLKLSEQQNEDWDVNIDVNEVISSSHRSLPTSSFQSLDATIINNNKIVYIQAEKDPKLLKLSQRTHKLRASTNKNSTQTRCKLKKRNNAKEQGSSPPAHTIQIKHRESEQLQRRPQHVRDFNEGDLNKYNQHGKSNNIQACTSMRLASVEMVNLSTDVTPKLTAPTVFSHRQEITCFSPSLIENEIFTARNTNVEFNTASTTKQKGEEQREIHSAVVNSCPVITNSNLTRLKSTQEQNLDNRKLCGISLSNHGHIKFKLSGRNGEKKMSEVDDIHDSNSVSSLEQNIDTLPKEVPVSISTQNKFSGLKINLTKSKKAKIKTSKKVQISQRVTRKSKHERMRDITNDIDREDGAVLGTEVASQRNNHSHKRLQQLKEEVKLFISSKNVNPSRIPMRKCPEKGCDYLYPLWRHLVVHIKHYHHRGKSHTNDWEGCRKAFTTSTKLNESRNKSRNTHNNETMLCCELCGKQFGSKSGFNSHQRKVHGTGKPGRYKCTFEGCNCTFMRKEKLELHLCTHSPECVLFCDKCGKQFGCQRYLDVHYKVHEKNVRNSLHPPEMTVACDVSGCKKTFTSRVYMKRHIISYHMGRRPRPKPGVLFACTIEGCGKKFSLKSTLSRHNLLVHKGGDYKLNRAIVKYPCTYSDCDKVLNRKNLLEEHMITEHGKVPRKLLTQQIREINCRERMCTKCGMVLALSQMAHHENIRHETESYLDMKESSTYTCQLEGCGVECGTQAELLAHVQKHTESPPFKCEVSDCKETFYLLKNLDNHLWNHSKKPSVCDVDGCSQTFDDQLQLAKHSKRHYDGRMKCPWKNCGSWFTAVGTLKQHFLAHSRSLIANFGWDFICDQCERVFSSKYGLKNHKKIHEDSVSENLSSIRTTKFVCEEPCCNTEFSQHKEFFDHFLHHYTNTPAACGFDGCAETLPTMLLKSKHGKSHYGGKYMCPWQNCDKMFSSSFFQVKKHLYRHILSIPSIAADRSHPCPQCDMVFRFERNLKNHTSQHSEKTDYVCTVCGKKFHYNHLKRHMLTHRQEKPHVCSHCGVRYGTVNGLKFHVLQQHKIGKWPFKCSYCDKGFISSTELRRHLPSHTKEKPFSCDLCGDTFATHTGYKGHMRKHAGQKFICDVEGCGKVYTTALSMRGHKAQHAGFSKMCSYCGKMYKNPYGHKCKAGREAKQKRSTQGPTNRNSIVIPSAPTISASAPASVSHKQCAFIITPSVATLGTDIQLADRNTMVSNSSQPAYLSVTSMIPNLTLRLPPDMPQDFIHALPSHGIVQDRSQPLALDITRGPSINIPGDNTFNNYVVFWDSQNVL